MRNALIALGLAGILGCSTGPRIETRAVSVVHGADVSFEWQTLRENRTEGKLPSYMLHAKYRRPGEKHWSELQAKVEFIGTPQEYAEMAIVTDGRRLYMTDGRVGSRDDKPDEVYVDGQLRSREERDYHGGDSAEIMWLGHALMARMPFSKAFTDEVRKRAEHIPPDPVQDK